MAILWGPVADKFGRVRTLILTILCFSIFTFLSAISTTVWQLAIYRFLAGIGIGGEWAMGGTFVAEERPEDRRNGARADAHRILFRIFLAALANYSIGSHFGWRAMFAFGIAEVSAGVHLYGVTEPARWVEKEKVVQTWAWRRPLATLFNRTWCCCTISNSVFMLISICGCVGTTTDASDGSRL